MHSIVEYDLAKVAENNYPKRIISPPNYYPYPLWYYGY
jgi:hypothetical protein